MAYIIPSSPPLFSLLVDSSAKQEERDGLFLMIFLCERYPTSDFFFLSFHVALINGLIADEPFSCT
jgi:hypothetical protein